MIRQYEAIVIFPTLLAGDKLEEAKKVFGEQVQKQGGQLIGVKEIGKRAFGYVVKKQREGIYCVIDFDLDPAKVTTLKRALTLTDSILRFSIHIRINHPAPVKQVETAPRPARPAAPTSSRT